MHSNFESEFLRLNDTKIHFLKRDTNKQKIILPHGLMTSGACFIPVADKLINDYDPIMPDSRDHGLSDKPKTGYDYKTLASDLLSLIEKTQTHPCILVGHSMGGMTAAIAASLKPSYFTKLILIDPSFIPKDSPHKVDVKELKAKHKQILEGSKQEFIAARKAQSLRTTQILQLLADARFQTSLNAFDILDPLHTDFTSIVKTLEMDTLLITGGEGAVVSDTLVNELIRLNIRIQVKNVKEAGHGIPFDIPEQLANSIKN